ncbi:MAG TPA: rod shape-determining protein MreC [Candidatus Coprovivens excrementavium]|nr:rod shape-determining protein MreC [Candidatus Coprovivens excrementavium]
MRFKRDISIKIIVVFLLFFFIFGLGYFLSYLRFNDKEIVTNEVIKKQNIMLKDELKKIQELSTIDGDYVIGRVIVRNLYNFLDEIIINVGSNEKIKEGDAVVNSDGLIGVVYKVLDKTSYVKLLTSNYNVSVKIGDLYGNLSQGKVTLLDKYSEIKEDTLVYTSGYGKIAEGIYIGKIKKVAMDKDNLGKEVIVDLIDNRHLNYIAVMRSK